MCPSHDKAAAFLPTCQRLPPQPVLKYQHPNPVLTSSSKTLNTQECLPFLHFSSARSSSAQPKGVRMWFPEVTCEVSRTPGCSFEIKKMTQHHKLDVSEAVTHSFPMSNPSRRVNISLAAAAGTSWRRISGFRQLNLHHNHIN